MLHAVMDIGSNAIRAVVYKSNKIASIKIYSNKFKADISSLLKKDNLDIKHQSYLIIEYFVHIFQQIGVTKVICVATAVLRGNHNAHIFQEIILRRYNIKIKILSGEQEAYLSTIGLMLGIQEVDGIVADLGGGSLELSLVQQQHINCCQSLLLGTKVLSNLTPKLNITSIIDDQLKSFSNSTHRNLYLIGGAFRLMTKSYMSFINYPINNLHNFCIQVSSILPYITKLVTINNNYHSTKFGIDINSLKILQALISAFNVQTIIISSYGLKEGVHVQHCMLGNIHDLPATLDDLNDTFSNFFDLTKSNKIIYEYCSGISEVNNNTCYIDQYIQTIKPLLVQADDATTQVIETLLIFIYNNRLESSFGINNIVEYILYELPMSHRLKLMLALTLSRSSHYQSMASNVIKIAKQILSKKDFYNSLIIGTITSVAQDVDGNLLQRPSFTLNIKDNFIELDTPIVLPRIVWSKIISKLKKISLLRKQIIYNYH